MSWLLKHPWKEGATILTAKLAVCTHCGTLRVTEPGAAAEVHYLVPGEGEKNRVHFTEPPCVKQPRRGGSIGAW